MKAASNLDTMAHLCLEMEQMNLKWKPEQIRPLAAALVERMKSETECRAISALGKALETLGSRLEAADVQPVARMHTEADSLAISSLSEALGSLCTNLSVHDRLKLHLESLRHPLAIGDVRDVLLKSLRDSGTFGNEHLYAGEDKDLDIWKFVDWAQDPERGGKYELSLRPPTKHTVK